MLPINETVKVEKEKYKIETLQNGSYLITGAANQFIIYREGAAWQTADFINRKLLNEIGRQIEELIWFRSNGI